MEQVDFTDLVRQDSKEIRNTHLNIGTGKEIDIKVLIQLVKNKIGFQGELVFKTKPNSSGYKLTDISKLHSLGWKHKIEIKEGIEKLII